MTGYGRGVVSRDGVRATVDVRAVNHRFLDLKLRGAAITPALEEAVASRVRAAIERGSITVSVHLAQEGVANPARIDHDAARRAFDMLAETAARLGIAGPELALVLAQPGVVVSGDDRSNEDPPVVPALEAALVQLDRMRATEGEALATELLARLDELVALRAQAATLAAGLPSHLAKRISERVRKLLEDAIEPARLAQEVAILADRADITEELVRLASHLDQARALVTTNGSVGRRLDFLVQEIGRELNTIGSKSALAELTAAVVSGKAALEKLREQVQNVE
jgi:uncharacterized protein (TIGR00255 family)